MVLGQPESVEVETRLLGERVRVPAHFDAEVFAVVQKSFVRVVSRNRELAQPRSTCVVCERTVSR